MRETWQALRCFPVSCSRRSPAQGLLNSGPENIPALGNRIFVHVQEIDALGGTRQRLDRVSQFPLKPCFLLIRTAHERVVRIFFFFRQLITGNPALLQGFFVFTGSSQKAGIVQMAAGGVFILLEIVTLSVPSYIHRRWQDYSREYHWDFCGVPVRWLHSRPQGFHPSYHRDCGSHKEADCSAHERSFDPDGFLFQRHRRSTRTGRQAINPARLTQGRIDYILFDREWTGTVTMTTGEQRRHLNGAPGRGHDVL